MKTLSFDQLPTEVARIGENVDRLTDLMKQFISPTTPPAPNQFGSEGALEYMRRRGITFSMSKLQKLTASKSIPFKKFCNRLVFDGVELDAWIDEHTAVVVDSSPALRLAASANRKTKGA